ncbi:hypothetical protein NMG60_11003260 [Bertholletia excelsa]
MLAKQAYANGYLQLYKLNHSCFIFRYSTSTDGILLKPSTNTGKFLAYCNSRITKNGRNGKIREAESVFNRMPDKNVVSWTAMLTAYADNGKIKKAREVFDEMPERNVASWNAMITAYIRNSCGIHEASELFGRMPERNAVSYAAMITGFVQAGKLEKAQELYAEAPVIWRDPVCSNALISGYLKMGELEGAIQIFDSMVEKDVVSWSSMIDGFCKGGKIREAKELFDKMPERNVVSWTAMINGYMKTGNFKDGFGFFLEMRHEESVKVNSTTLTVIFEACGNDSRYVEGHQMHGLVLCMGFDFDVFLGNSIITMYCRFGCVDAANNIFNMMSKKDIVSWNSLISGYVQTNEIDKACRLFEEVPVKDVISWTTMITGFFNRGMTEKSIELFNLMPEKDDVAWTAVISGFVNNGVYEEAISCFIKMLQNKVRPNPLTLSSVISAAAGLATLDQGLQIHTHVLKRDMEFDLSIQNSLVSMYSKCGSTEDASKIFQSIRTPNVVSFNSMITGFAQNGLAREAIKLLKRMSDEGQEPNEVTFLGILSACTHGGLVEEGWNIFRSMKSLYDILPGPDHYACMVDLLGRYGFLDEAMDLINSMPFKSHSGVWGALLGASRMHVRLDVAKLAAQHLFNLQPDNATPYVVLHDIYSISGKGKTGEQVRVMKKLKGIRKSPGCSWIIGKDKINLFLSGDQSHVSFQEISRTLGTIMDEIKQPKDNDMVPWLTEPDM